MIDEDAIRYVWDMAGSKFDECGRRMFAAGEVRTAGRGRACGGLSNTGLTRSTINRGDDDLDREELPKGHDWGAFVVLFSPMLGSTEGAPGYSPVTIFKIVLLQQWHTFSGP